MQYRKITEKEQMQVVQANAIAFNSSSERDLNRIEKGRFYHDMLRCAVDENGKIVSSMRLVPLEMYFDNKIVKCGGIGDVATFPEHRRKGHVRKLFELVFDEMAAEGYTLSYLYPFSYNYYRMFGYENAYMVKAITVPNSALSAMKNTGFAKQFIPGEDGTDPEDIINIYNSFAGNMNFMVDRDAYWWEKLLERDPYKSKARTYIWYNEDSTAKAFFRYEYEHNDGKCYANIKDICWIDHEGLLGIFGFINKYHANMEILRFECPPNLIMDDLVPEIYDIKTILMPGGMVRIIDVKRALEIVKKPKIKASIVFDIRDDSFNYNTGKYLLEMDGRNTSVKKGVDKDADIILDIQTLAQVLSGFKKFDELKGSKNVEVFDKQDILRQLFVKKDIFITDHV